MDVTLTSAGETILNTSKRDDTNCDSQGFEMQRVEPGPALEDQDASIAIALKELTSEEVK